MSKERDQNPEQYARLYLVSMRDEMCELKAFMAEVSVQDEERLSQPPHKLPSRSQRLIISAVSRLAEAGRQLIGSSDVKGLVPEWLTQQETELVKQLIGLRNIAQHGYLNTLDDRQLWGLLKGGGCDALEALIQRLCDEHLPA